jgi:8-oxo-dGTP pyrophosphatase MutT (NUDIX family)
VAHKEEKARQGAAVPYRWTPFGTLEVLLVSTRRGRWTLPKGGIKKGCDAREAARRESLERIGSLSRVLASHPSRDGVRGSGVCP